MWLIYEQVVNKYNLMSTFENIGLILSILIYGSLDDILSLFLQHKTKTLNSKAHSIPEN